LFLPGRVVIDSFMVEKAGTLFVVSTPIGNLEDMTLRALRVLKEVDMVACEDTRRSRRLLPHYGIEAPLVSYYAPKESQKMGYILERLREGRDVALITDAGTPLLSDPGWRLVREALDAGIAVVPVPGPSSVLAALVASGFPLQPFTFWGFPPRNRGDLVSFLKEIGSFPGVHVFFESPGRLLSTLEVMLQERGNRRAVVARELTKVHEEFIRGSLAFVWVVVARREGVKGDFVLLV